MLVVEATLSDPCKMYHPHNGMSICYRTYENFQVFYFYLSSFRQTKAGEKIGGKYDPQNSRGCKTDYDG